MGSLVGSVLGFLGAEQQGDDAVYAAEQSAKGQLEAAKIGADAAKFRPVGITNRFGNSNFSFDGNGYLNGAGYSLSPELQRLQEMALGSAGDSGVSVANSAMGAGNSLFNLGSQYLATSPQAAAQQWMSGQQNLLSPSRERQLSNVRTNLFNTGREGLAVGATGTRPDGSAGLGASNPELEAYYNSLAQQDALLASQATAEGRNAVNFGNTLVNNGMGLFSSAWDPMKSSLGVSQSIDTMGQGALTLGSALGGRAAESGSTVGQMLMKGGMGAAQTMFPANAQSPFGSTLMGLANNKEFTNGAGNWLKGLWSTGASGTFTPSQGAYASGDSSAWWA